MEADQLQSQDIKLIESFNDEEIRTNNLLSSIEDDSIFSDSEEEQNENDSNRN